MKLEQLEKANLLLETIDRTEEALTNLRKLESATNKKMQDRGEPENFLDDGLFTLHIGEHSDMSGHSADLVRYGGNVRLLSAMIHELEIQLEIFKKQFEEL